MSEVFALLKGWPTWAGSLPMWGVFLLLVVSAFKPPELAKLWIDARKHRADSNSRRIRELETAVKECQEECRENERLMQNTINALRNAQQNEAAQRVQSEISLVNTLIQVVDAPELRRILTALEQRKVMMANFTVIGGPIDNQGAEDEGTDDERA